MTQTTTKFFCTYQNAETKKETKWGWKRSKNYTSIEELVKAMTSYLVSHPHTLVQYQTENSFTSQP